jgi:hypothetical protein
MRDSPDAGIDRDQRDANLENGSLCAVPVLVRRLTVSTGLALVTVAACTLLLWILDNERRAEQAQARAARPRRDR